MYSPPTHYTHYTHTHTHSLILTHTHTHMLTHTHTHAYTLTHTLTHAHTHTLSHTHTRTRTHTHTHTHAHTHAHSSLWLRPGGDRSPRPSPHPPLLGRTSRHQRHPRQLHRAPERLRPGWGVALHSGVQRHRAPPFLVVHLLRVGLHLRGLCGEPQCGCHDDGGW